MAKTNASKKEAAMSASSRSRNPVINAVSLFRPSMSDARSRWATDFIQERGVRRLLPSIASSSFANHEFDIVLCAELPSGRQTFWRGGSGERKPKPIAIFRVCAEDTDADRLAANRPRACFSTSSSKLERTGTKTTTFHSPK